MVDLHNQGVNGVDDPDFVSEENLKKKINTIRVDITTYNLGHLEFHHNFLSWIIVYATLKEA